MVLSLNHPARPGQRWILLRSSLAALILLINTLPPEPVTATWFAAHSLALPRTNHTATALADGSVLVAGGSGPSGFGPVGETERYEPATGRWRLTDALTIRRSGHAAARLPDGTVLVVGGHNALLDPSTTSERYNPATDTWSRSGALRTGRAGGHSATVLADGSVLVVGGYNRVSEYGSPIGSPIASIERYTPATGAWSSAGSLVKLATVTARRCWPTGAC